MSEERTNPGRNGGTLKVGNKGNRGGWGMTNSIRVACRHGFAAGLPLVAKIARGEATEGNPCPDYKDILSAWQGLGKYGVGEVASVGVEDAEVARIAVSLVFEMFGPDRVGEFSDRLVDALGLVGDDDDPDGPSDDAP